MPVSAPPTSLDEWLFSIFLVLVPLVVRFSVSSGCARRRHLGSPELGFLDGAGCSCQPSEPLAFLFTLREREKAKGNISSQDSLLREQSNFSEGLGNHIGSNWVRYPFPNQTLLLGQCHVLNPMISQWGSGTGIGAEISMVDLD